MLRRRTWAATGEAVKPFGDGAKAITRPYRPATVFDFRRRLARGRAPASRGGKPKTRVAGWFLATLPGGEPEPIAGRIIEVPEDLERFELRDARSHFIAYVPPGSVEQGRQLANTGGNGKSAPCTICHGPELNGVGPIPGLAGRSPSYLVRQLYDFQHGTRAGPWSPLMAPNVINLTLDDMVALAAYAASLPP